MTDKGLPELTATEMVKALLGKGWDVLSDEETNDISLKNPSGGIYYSVGSAYRKAFPRKKKVTVDGWIGKGYGEIIRKDPGDPTQWIKGQFTYEVEE